MSCFWTNLEPFVRTEQTRPNECLSDDPLSFFFNERMKNTIFYFFFKYQKKID
jgi:hypothetical protein